MKVVINGKQTTLEGNPTVAGLLVSQKVKMPEMVSVELNGKILRPNLFDTTRLAENDQVEFLYFMGGGGS